MALLLPGKIRAIEGLIEGTIYVGVLNNGTEVTGGAYARQPIVNTDWQMQPGGSYRSTILITYPIATAAWGTINQVALYDQATAGDKLADGMLRRALDIEESDSLTFQPGNLRIMF